MRNCNGLVACSPFSVKKDDASKGLKFHSEKMELTKLTVVFNYSYSDKYTIPELIPGDIVYVRGDKKAAHWANERLTVAGVPPEFILVPVNDIVGFDRGHNPDSSST